MCLLPVCCAADLSSEVKCFRCSCSTQQKLTQPFAMQQFLNRFIKLEEKKIDLDLMIFIVDNLNKTYTEILELPMAASPSPALFKKRLPKSALRHSRR